MSAEKSIFFIVILGLFCFFYTPISAQYHPGPQDSNTNAIHKNDTSFSFWANDIEINRGWKNITDTTLGKAYFGLDENALGKSNNATISLGDSGQAILNFPFPIYNINGNDFAVFENGFAQNDSPENEYFLELAIVEVSQDGIDFIPFNSHSNIPFTSQTETYTQLNCTKINNIAGKHPKDYGTPFDIDELGLDSIIAIKVTDVVGSINTSFATYDSQGNIINDPFPTPFGSSGFDLNAIGALNQPNKIETIDSTIETSLKNLYFDNFKIYPNPVNDNLFISIKNQNVKEFNIELLNNIGEIVFVNSFKERINIKTSTFSKGIYYLKIYNADIFKTSKIIIE